MNTARLSRPAYSRSRMRYARFVLAANSWSKPSRADKELWRPCLERSVKRLRRFVRQYQAEARSRGARQCNCPGQIVVSGTAEGLQGVVERGKEAGAKRVIPLEVSGPFHSSLMKPAAERLQRRCGHWMRGCSDSCYSQRNGSVLSPKLRYSGLLVSRCIPRFFGKTLFVI